MQPRMAVILAAAILLCALFVAGCTDRESQPPPSVRTLAPTPVTTTTTVRPAPTPVVTTPGPTPVPEPGTIAQSVATLRVSSPVMGYRGTGGSYVDLITFDLMKVPSADPVDMENVQVTMTRYDETTGLLYEIRGKRNGNRDNILETGEVFSIAVSVKPGYWIYRNDPFELRVLIPGSPPVTVLSRGPAVIQAENLLATP